MKKKTPLTDRVNVEPAIINGMTSTEANYIAVVSFALSLFVAVALFVITGFWPLLVLFCIGGPVLALWYGSLYLQTVKRNRPDAFYVQAVHIWLSKNGIGRCSFNRHNRFYEIGASINLNFNPPLDMKADSEDNASKNP
ncbi:TIGR03750 family conjugal transfer protein [Comamonas sp. CMM01]|uniref:TIGR03750 family conjugal transfer protein n=1 Tax=Comamonas sp. CMM01 TaxID=2769280 RepID=UPI0017832BB8|nr:TIGR03750 family conjugal transfer protein [Comamonas sp. CMM01]MBD9534186.1 TIGR03750 family conjugal transfer protein [Comamonas sp. CMM01]